MSYAQEEINPLKKENKKIFSISVLIIVKGKLIWKHISKSIIKR